MKINFSKMKIDFIHWFAGVKSNSFPTPMESGKGVLMGFLKFVVGVCLIIPVIAAFVFCMFMGVWFTVTPLLGGTDLMLGFVSVVASMVLVAWGTTYVHMGRYSEKFLPSLKYTLMRKDLFTFFDLFFIFRHGFIFCTVLAVFGLGDTSILWRLFMVGIVLIMVLWSSRHILARYIETTKAEVASHE